MAIPVVGGISMALLTLLTVPVLYSLAREREAARLSTPTSP